MRRGRRRRRSEIVNDVPAGAPPATWSAPEFTSESPQLQSLVLFGLTIVVKRVPSAYAVPEDDDV